MENRYAVHFFNLGYTNHFNTLYDAIKHGVKSGFQYSIYDRAIDKQVYIKDTI